MRRGDLGERDQGDADVAQLLEQAVQRGLVDHGPADDGGAVVLVVMLSPSNQADQRDPRCPSTRISYCGMPL